MQKFSLRKLPAVTLALIGVWVFLRFLLPVLLPFLLAALLALAAEPLVSLLHEKLKLPRAASAAIGVTIALLIAVLLTLSLCAILIRQVGSLAGVLPDLEGAVLNGMGSLERWMLNMAEKAPDGIRSVVSHSVSNMFSGGSALLDRLTETLLALATTVLKGLPDSALGLGTWVLASFMISSRLPKIKDAIAARLPQSWQEEYLPQLRAVRSSFGGWLLAQGKLVAVTFGVLTAGFLLLRIAHPLLWAAVICLVDILPVLGTGTVLIPWGLVCFLQGDTLRGIGLLGIYGVVSLLRSVLEPRLVGKQLGLDPLTTLLSLYAGYRFWGLMGMVFAPVLAALTAQILRAHENKT